MFCPRCGNQINEGLKFCRSCGLPITQISTYVATGGTAPLAQIPGQLPGMPPAAGTPGPPEYLTPKQQMIFTILILIFATPVLGILSEIMGFDGELVAIPAVLTPLGIVWAVFHYKAQMRRRSYLQQQSLAPQIQAPTAGQEWTPQMNAPRYQATLAPPRTNPLGETGRGSVVEDETRKLPEKR